MTTSPRLVSLLPSGTEILCALGLETSLVGISQTCDYPPSVQYLPRLTTAHRPHILPTTPLDMPHLVRHGLSPYAVDLSLLRSVRPDVIVTRPPTGIPWADVVQGTQEFLGKPVKIVALQPAFLQDIWDDIHLLGMATGRAHQARTVLDTLFARVNALIAESMMLRQPPRVAVLTGIEPCMVAGYWVPDMVQIVGGRMDCVTPGQPQARITWDALQAYRPEVLLVRLCGLSLAETQTALQAIHGWPGWQEIPAVRSGQVSLIDGHGSHLRPGPRIVDALDLLAGLIHPDIFADRLPPTGQGYYTLPLP